MATTKQINGFIAQIAPIAQKAYKELGKVLPSVAIGMACVECGYGTAGSCKHHSYLGHKVGSGRIATKYWGGRFFTSKTGEEYQIGVHTTITAAFRAFDSMEQCVFNFYELLNTNIYKSVKSGVDYKTQMEQIKAAGYMTSSTEVNSVISIIKKYGLTAWDNLDMPNPLQATPHFVVGRTYTLTSNMYIRTEPNGRKKALAELTADGRKNAFKDAAGAALLKKGTRVTLQDVKTSANGAIWLKIPSGYVCGVNSGGKAYVT
ncbi:MAG: glucosaminidase domain-containing protein [Lachnospiraceae bacterium]|nr:glucosaminidase domain-containing protein [Lachnospiraceae bacterium]